MAAFSIFKENVYPLADGRIADVTLLNAELAKICHYVKYASFFLKDDKRVIAVIFPDHTTLEKPDYVKTPEDGCFCPRNLKELGKCLCGCTATVNLHLPFGYARIEKALIIMSTLSQEDGTLTAEGIPNPEQILKKYENHLQNLYGKSLPVTEEVFVMNFND